MKSIQERLSFPTMISFNFNLHTSGPKNRFLAAPAIRISRAACTPLREQSASEDSALGLIQVEVLNAALPPKIELVFGEK